ncbi:MAG: flagellar export chaperone FliS [Rhodocyclaceae bacterium]|nr:flagellar export chaperone FliS [Rhodocyclaceae bacterium]
MFASLSNPAAAYRKAGIETSIETKSPHQLVLMLFEGALSQIAIAGMYITQKDITAKGKAIGNAINIIDGGLRACLDHNAGGELSERLAALYEYMCNRLLHANLHNDQAALTEVAALLGELKSGWEEIANDPAVVSANKSAA